MSARHLAWAISQKVPTSDAKLILILLAECTDGGGNPHLSSTTTDWLAHHSSMLPSEVERHLEWLKKDGFIRPVGLPADGQQLWELVNG
jgi:hypothetical protein